MGGYRNRLTHAAAPKSLADGCDLLQFADELSPSVWRVLELSGASHALNA